MAMPGRIDGNSTNSICPAVAGFLTGNGAQINISKDMEQLCRRVVFHGAAANADDTFATPFFLRKHLCLLLTI